MLLVSSAPNSSPAQLRFLKRMLLLVAGVGTVGMAGAVLAQVCGRTALATCARGLPAVFCVVLVAVLARAGS